VDKRNLQTDVIYVNWYILPFGVSAIHR